MAFQNADVLHFAFVMVCKSPLTVSDTSFVVDVETKFDAEELIVKLVLKSFLFHLVWPMLKKINHSISKKWCFAFCSVVVHLASVPFPVLAKSWQLWAGEKLLTHQNRKRKKCAVPEHHLKWHGMIVKAVAQHAAAHLQNALFEGQ